VACSIDGYIADRNGGVAWLDPFMDTGDDYGYSEFIASVDALIMGRGTYEKVLSFGTWPYGNLRCLVLTQRALEPAAPEVRIRSGEPGSILDGLRGEGFTHAWLVGGADLAGQFVARGLITDYVISYVPVVLGDGIPLWRCTGSLQSLELASLQRHDSDVVTLHLRDSGTSRQRRVSS
jgi:dihydrofolate reductase